MLAILQLLTNGAWGLVWLLATVLAIWQILRGRAIAGALLGLAAVVGIVGMVAQSLLRPVWAILNDAIGYELSGMIASLTYGCVDGFGLLLLVVAAVVQRPPRETG